LAVASAYGADEVISIEAYPDPADREDVVRALTNGRGADVVCDFSGAPGVLGERLDLAAPNGRYLVLGSTSAPPQLIDAAAVVVRNLTLFGSASGEIDAGLHAGSASGLVGGCRSTDERAVAGEGVAR
jgi:threonine dehydrogenase-like Zn-dependent dehydrogenase